MVDGADEERIVDGRRPGTHGLFRAGAFQAARIRRPSIEYSGVVSPPGPISWSLNIGQVPPALRLSVSPIYIALKCDPFATYRPGLPA